MWTRLSGMFIPSAHYLRAEHHKDGSDFPTSPPNETLCSCHQITALGVLAESTIICVQQEVENV